MRRPWTLVAAVATIAVFPSAASAATVELVDGTVVFTASPGERNAVSAGTRVLGPPLRFGIVDTGAPLTVGDGCTALDANTAVCGDEASATTLPVVMELGDGDDTLFFEDVAGARELTVSGETGDDTIRVGSGSGFDPLVYGGPGDDTLTANMNLAGTPVLRGGKGNDLLRNIGEAGALLYGEVGDDRLFCECVFFRGDDPSYRLDGGKDDDTYSFTVFQAGTVNTAGMIDPSPGFDTLDLGGASGPDTGFAFSSCPRCVEQVLGTDAAEVLTGDDRDQVIRGGGGDDVIAGGRGIDALFGGDGNDEIDARDGSADVVSCGAGTDHVLADRRDKVAGDCESVTFAAPSG